MSIIKLSKQIPDPRVTGRTVHKMEHIIYITIAAVLAGCQTWDDIAEFGRTKKEFFKSRLVGLEHIPSHDTFNRFFSIFDPKGRVFKIRLKFGTFFSRIIGLTN